MKGESDLLKKVFNSKNNISNRQKCQKWNEEAVESILNWRSITVLSFKWSERNEHFLHFCHSQAILSFAAFRFGLFPEHKYPGRIFGPLHWFFYFSRVRWHQTNFSAAGSLKNCLGSFLFQLSDSNLGRVGTKRERYRCAKPSPQGLYIAIFLGCQHFQVCWEHTKLLTYINV